MGGLNPSFQLHRQRMSLTDELSPLDSQHSLRGLCQCSHPGWSRPACCHFGPGESAACYLYDSRILCPRYSILLNPQVCRRHPPRKAPQSRQGTQTHHVVYVNCLRPHECGSNRDHLWAMYPGGSSMGPLSPGNMYRQVDQRQDGTFTWK